MDTYALAVQQLKKAIENAIEKAITNGELPQAEAAPFIIETPADRSHGDFATNAAMAGAKAFRMPPFKIAQAITSNLNLEGTMFDRFETAGPGFINFFLGFDLNYDWYLVHCFSYSLAITITIKLFCSSRLHKIVH